MYVEVESFFIEDSNCLKLAKTTEYEEQHKCIHEYFLEARETKFMSIIDGLVSGAIVDAFKLWQTRFSNIASFLVIPISP